MKRVKGRAHTAVELAEARRERAQIEEWRRQSEEMAPRRRPVPPRHRQGLTKADVRADLLAVVAYLTGGGR